MKNWILFVGGLMGVLSIVIGASGAHILGETVSKERMSIFETGLDFHKFHAMLLVVLGISKWLVTDKNSQRMIAGSSFFAFIGILLFSFGMYAGVVTGNQSFYILNPFGGICFMLSWGILMIWGFKGRVGES
jgi:uncharacterized membrane protein YgdD (TMEM256/DUF423 family)